MCGSLATSSVVHGNGRMARKKVRLGLSLSRSQALKLSFSRCLALLLTRPLAVWLSLSLAPSPSDSLALPPSRSLAPSLCFSLSLPRSLTPSLPRSRALARSSALLRTEARHDTGRCVLGLADQDGQLRVDLLHLQVVVRHKVPVHVPAALSSSAHESPAVVRAYTRTHTGSPCRRALRRRLAELDPDLVQARAQQPAPRHSFAIHDEINAEINAEIEAKGAGAKGRGRA